MVDRIDCDAGLDPNVDPPIAAEELDMPGISTTGSSSAIKPIMSRSSASIASRGRSEYGVGVETVPAAWKGFDEMLVVVWNPMPVGMLPVGNGAG